MIRAGLISTDDNFHRAVRGCAAEAGVRVDCGSRSYHSGLSFGALDVLIVHNPSTEDLQRVIAAGGPLPVVVACLLETANSIVRDQDGWAAVPDDDPTIVVAAARAAALGLSVLPAHPGAHDDGDPDANDERDGADPFELSDAARPSVLTARETDVMRLAVGGASNRDIADELGVSENTVKYHLASVYSKLGVTRRSELVFEAIRRGLVSV